MGPTPPPPSPGATTRPSPSPLLPDSLPPDPRSAPGEGAGLPCRHTTRASCAAPGGGTAGRAPRAPAATRGLTRPRTGGDDQVPTEGAPGTGSGQPPCEGPEQVQPAASEEVTRRVSRRGSQGGGWPSEHMSSGGVAVPPTPRHIRPRFSFHVSHERINDGEPKWGLSPEFSLTRELEKAISLASRGDKTNSRAYRLL